MDSRRYDSRDESNSSQRKEHIQIQPMRYKLTKLTQADTLNQIAMKTSGFYDMSINSVIWVQRDVRSREFSSFGSLKAPQDMKLVDLITGDNDYYLKLTMKKHDVDYICYDNDFNQFQVWGEYQCCIRAMNELRYRIEKVSQREGAKKWPTSKGNKYDEEEERDAYACDAYAYARDAYARDAYACDAYACDAYARREYALDDVLDEYTDDEYGRDAKRQRKENDTAPRKYSKFANSQMSKMGFTQSKGLGRNNTGRLEPIDPVTDLGGRTSRNNFGFGFSELVKDVDSHNDLASSPPPPSNDEEPRSLSRSMSIIHEEEPFGMSRSMSCSYYNDESPCSMMQSMSIISEEEEKNSTVRSMSVTAD